MNNTEQDLQSHTGTAGGSRLRNAFFGGAGTHGAMTAVMQRMLDEIDYGLVLVTPTGALRYANQLALRSLTGGAGLHLDDNKVCAPKAAEQATLRAALADAVRGLRRLLAFKAGGKSFSVAVLPMSSDDSGALGGDAGEPLVMLVLGKQPANENLTLEFFARSQRLTAAEATVLHGLCGGLQPKEIARQVGVQISTVRSQIGSIRVKTETTSIRDLLEKVAALPPITPAVKNLPVH